MEELRIGTGVKAAANNDGRKAIATILNMYPELCCTT